MTQAHLDEKTDFVIVRSFRNEPVKLRVLSVREDAVEVAGSDPSRSIGYPRRLVYRFDEELFDQLRAAFAAGDRQRLDALWRKAEVNE